MRFHDYHLSKYEVSDTDKTITLHLAYDYPGSDKDTSYIRFSEVAIYNFTHTSRAIITDIEELPISDLMLEVGSQLVEWNRMYGVYLWKDSLQDYSFNLQTEGYRAWCIDSAIGFYGFVIAKMVDNV